MSDRDTRLIGAKLEAAFNRYSLAVLSGQEPSPDLFIESLAAEGLRLGLTSPASAISAPGERRVAERRANYEPVGLGRRGPGLLGRRLRGLP